MTSHVNKFRMVKHTIVEELDLENKPSETVHCVNKSSTKKAYLLQTIEFLRTLLFSLLFVLNYNWSDRLHTISPCFVIYTKLCIYDSLMHNIVIVIIIVICCILQS